MTSDPTSGARPSWHDTFMAVAEVWARRSTCPRRHVGAVIVQNHRVIASGYNGSPAGEPHCSDPDVGCLMVDGHCERTVHAEHNAILQCASTGVDPRGAIMYCTVNPCFKCRMFAKQVGITKFYYPRDSEYVDRAPEVAAL